MLPEKIKSTVQQREPSHSKPNRFPVFTWRFHEEAQDKLRKGTQAAKGSSQFDIAELLPAQGDAVVRVAWAKRLVAEGIAKQILWGKNRVSQKALPRGYWALVCSFYCDRTHDYQKT